jgi:hypothetical protein
MPYAIYSTQDFDAAESERIRRAIDGLSAYLEAVVKFQEEHPPTADSPIGKASEANGGRWWFETGELPLAASIDHLGAFVTLLRGPVPRQAGYSVLRGSVEASAIAWWLFDPTVAEKERVQRGFEERLHAIHTQRGLAPHVLDEIEQRRRALVEEAVKFGLHEKDDSRSEGLTHLGRPRLQIQDLLVRILPEKPPDADAQTRGEFLWRSLSAWSHSEMWTNVVGLSIVEDDRQPRNLAVNIPILMVMCTLTQQVFDKAFGRRMELAGHPTWEQERGVLPVL